MNKGINLFYSYTPQDEPYREKLEKHLIVLKRRGILNSWHKREVQTSVGNTPKIDEYLDKSQIVLLLISSDFLASDYCYGIELKATLERHKAQDAVVIPVILTPVDWKDTDLGNIKSLPSNGKPVSLWEDEDEALANISKGIQEQVDCVRDYLKKKDSLNKNSASDEILDIASLNFQSKTNLPSAIEKYGTIINDILICFLESDLSGKDSKKNALGVIKTFFSAEFVYLSRLNSNFILEDEKSDSRHSSIPIHELDLQLKSRFSSIWLDDKPCKLIIDFDLSNGSNAYRVCLIPFPSQKVAESRALVILLNENSLEILDDLLSLVIVSLFVETNGFENFSKSVDELKSSVYDCVKRTYSYVSDQIYQERFDIFKEDLEVVQMLFEPIIFFEEFTKSIDVWGWEALARDKRTHEAPSHLFKAAELWGLQFQTELDLICLENSVRTYRQVLDLQVKTDPKGKRLQTRLKDIKPLTINVYPNTLMRTSYRNKIAQLLQYYRISGRKIILEISEKTLLTNPHMNEDEKKLHIENFKDTMGDLRDELKVSFAIDDFGVGNSSISRLIQLMPEYVKIDRDIILSEKALAMQIIRSINNVRSNRREVWKVIVEGFDSRSELSLQEIVNDIGIEFIQGHSLLEGDFSIKTRIDNETFNRISQELNWNRSWE